MTDYHAMRLIVQLPYERRIDEEVTSVVAESTAGEFCLLPNHVDCVASLVPSLLTLRNAAGHERVVAVDDGTLVKCGAEVRISTRRAVEGAELGALHALVEREFQQQSERERAVLTAMARLESSLIRRFLDFAQEP